MKDLGRGRSWRKDLEALVFEAHRLLFDTTLGSTVIKKKKTLGVEEGNSRRDACLGRPHHTRHLPRESECVCEKERERECVYASEREREREHERE